MRLIEFTTRHVSLRNELIKLRPLFVEAVQKIYDKWNVKKYGDGICVIIAEKFENIVNKNWYEFKAFAEARGQNKSETHTFVIVFNETESYIIDIPYWKYETSKKMNSFFGIVPRWKKIPNVIFTEKDIRIIKIPRMKFMDEGYYKRSWKNFNKGKI